jgi:hypothetical protein
MTNKTAIVKVCNPFGDQVAVEDIRNGKKLIKKAGRTYLWNTLTQSFEGSSSSTTIAQMEHLSNQVIIMR